MIIFNRFKLFMFAVQKYVFFCVLQKKTKKKIKI